MSETTAAPAPAATAAPAATDAAASTPATAAPADVAEGSLLGSGTDKSATTEATVEATPTSPAIPEKYEFTAPEINGKALEVDPAALAGFDEIARKAGLTQEQYQAVAQHGVARLAELAAAPQQAYATLQKAWQDEVRAHPEIGGDKLPAALAHAARALDAFGGDALKQALDATGAGNHPAVVKAFVDIGKAIGEGQGFSRGAPVGAAGKVKSAEQYARDFYNANGGNYPDLK